MSLEDAYAYTGDIMVKTCSARYSRGHQRLHRKAGSNLGNKSCSIVTWSNSPIGQPKNGEGWGQISNMSEVIHIVGGGMAGSEAARQAANMGVRFACMFAPQSGNLCSSNWRPWGNGLFQFLSLRRSRANAVGLLHWEMLKANGLIMHKAYAHRIPAGGALAVDRAVFAQNVTKLSNASKHHGYIYDCSCQNRDWICHRPDLKHLVSLLQLAKRAAFFDAIALIIYFDSIDMSVPDAIALRRRQ